MSKVIEVIKSFKYSVNIKDDFLDAQKLNGFFATQKNSEFIFRTLETIRNGNNKAILLSGAYGTGKSFLVSIIAAFLSGKLKIDSDLQELKSKLVSHDDSYQKILNQVRNKKYLIVFPDDSFASFSQAICLGITEVIHSENLPIVLNSTFDGIIQRISRWENEHPVFYTALLEALKEKRWTISKLLKKLKLFDPVAYRIFEEIYPLILGGEKFVPLGNANNITAVMRDFEQAVKAVGYDGVLYIFDEFGRFLENNIESLDVKQIQDAAEYCNSGTDSSLVLISHKDIFQYSQRIHNEFQRDEWEKVSGRFAKTHLLYEENNILTIIESILKKHPTIFRKLITKNRKIVDEQVEALERLAIHSPEQALKGFYPLNYVTAIMLPKLSQRLAQNERTLFAFLCGNEPLAFNNIFVNDDKSFCLLAPDVLYDYFEDNFLFLGTDSREYKVYLNARTIIKTLASNSNDLKLVKILTLFYLLNEFNELPPNHQFLCFASGLSEKEFQSSLSRLQQKGAIAYRKHLDRYILSQDIDFNIDADIARELADFENLDYSTILEQYIPQNVEYPVEYNYEYKITRYFSRHFVDVSSLGNIDDYFADKVQDGVIFYVTNFSKEKKFLERLRDASKLFADAIFICPSDNSFQVHDTLARLEALSRIEGKDDTFRSSTVAKEELTHYRDELTNYIENRVARTWSSTNSLQIIYYGESHTATTPKEYQHELSSFLQRKYSLFTHTFIVNYELITKAKLTVPIKNARKEILRAIMNGILGQEYFKSTGAANSIARITLLNTHIWRDGNIDFTGTRFETLANDIAMYLEGAPRSYADIITYFASNQSKYGFRAGTMSFFMGFFLLCNRNNILISYENAEVSINEDILDVLEGSPEKYIITLFQIPEEARAHLQNLLDNPFIGRFVGNEGQNRDITILLYEAFKKLVFSLPKILFTAHPPQTTVPLARLITGLEANNSKNFFFQRLPRLYNSDDWVIITNTWSEDVQRIMLASEVYTEQIRSLTREAIAQTNQQLGLCITAWKRGLSPEQQRRLETSSLPWQIDGHFAEDELLRQTTSAVRGGIDLYQWRSMDDILDYNNALITEIQTIIEGHPTLNFDAPVQLSELGRMLKQKLRTDIEAFKGISLQEIQNAIIQLIQELSLGRNK